MAPISQFKAVPVKDIGNTFEDLYESPALTTSYLIQLDIANTSNTGVQIDLVYDDGVNETYLAKNVPIPVGATLPYVDGQKQVINPQHKLKLKCNTPGETVDVMISLIEDVNS